MESLDDSYKLRRGDLVLFKIVEDSPKTFRLRVRDDGNVLGPYVEPIPADGKTCRELAHEFKRHLEKRHFKKATVVIGVQWIAAS